MKQWLIQLLQRGRNPLLVALGFLPVPLLVTAYFVPEFLPFVWVWPLSYLLLDLAGTYVRGKRRILYAVFQLAAVVGITLLMGFPPKSVWVALMAIMYIVLLLAELPYSGEERYAPIYLLKYVVVGVFVNLVAQFLLAYGRRYGKPVLEPIAPWLTVAFFLFIVLGLLMLNGANLLHSSRGRFGVSKAIKRKNMVFTLIIIAVAGIVAVIPGVVSGLRGIFGWLVKAIRMLVDRLTDNVRFGGSNVIDGDVDMSEPESVELEEVPITPEWVEPAVTIFVVTIACAAIAYGVYFLVRKLMVFAKFLRRTLQQYMHAASDDYVDVITDTRDEDDPLASREKKQKKLSAASIRKLTPGEQIRYRYWLLMQKHPEWTKGSTARENLNYEAANVYERVRYSGYPVGEEDAKNFAEETKKV